MLKSAESNLKFSPGPLAQLAKDEHMKLGDTSVSPTLMMMQSVSMYDGKFGK